MKTKKFEVIPAYKLEDEKKEEFLKLHNYHQEEDFDFKFFLVLKSLINFDDVKVGDYSGMISACTIGEDGAAWVEWGCIASNCKILGNSKVLSGSVVDGLIMKDSAVVTKSTITNNNIKQTGGVKMSGLSVVKNSIVTINNGSKFIMKGNAQLLDQQLYVTGSFKLTGMSTLQGQLKHF